MESTAGCWAAYGGVLARQYSDASYAAAGQLTADAFAVQHPGQPSAQSIQSVALHLMSLCLMLEREVSTSAATEFIRSAAQDKSRFVWLAPPEHFEAITVADVHAAQTATQHIELVRAWAVEAWRSWSAHHATVRKWLSVAGKHRRLPRAAA